MAIIQALLALVTRSLGRILSAIFGWAVVALFGQTSGTEKVALSAVVGAAAAWPILLIGIAAPKTAALVLAFVPVPAWVPSWAVRTVWIGLAALVPLAVGMAMAMRRPAGPHAMSAAGQESWLTRLLRGVPVTVAISAAFLIVFVTVPVLRVISLIRRRVDVHVPLVTDARGYELVAAEVARTLSAHGFDVRPAKPGWWMTTPSRILLRLGGPSFRAYVPARLAYFRGPRLEAALYPNALLLRGEAQDTAWAQGVVVEALTDAPAYQTFDPGAQDIERQIRSVWAVYEQNPEAHRGATALRRRLEEIAREIRKLPVSYDEWQVVYRQALQLDRALDGAPQLLEAVTNGGAPRRNGAEEALMATTVPRAEPVQAMSTRELIAEILGKASLLIKTEAELAKAEIKADLQSQLAVVKGLAVALVCGLLALNMLLVALVLGLTTWIAGWLAALLTAGVLLALGAVIGYIGWTRRVIPLAVTRKTLKEDVQWAKERLA
jgi:Putative Actinobacterial Holin-X, holin superfamily III